MLLGGMPFNHLRAICPLKIITRPLETVISRLKQLQESHTRVRLHESLPNARNSSDLPVLRFRRAPVFRTGLRYLLTPHVWDAIHKDDNSSRRVTQNGHRRYAMADVTQPSTGKLLVVLSK
jgi:hypothetical protein